MKPTHRTLSFLLAVASLAAGADTCPSTLVPASEDWSRDILHTALLVDVAAQTATAVIRVAPSGSTGLSLEVGDLAILEVTDAGGAPLDFLVHEKQLDVGIPVSDVPADIVVDYRYTTHTDFDGELPSGATFTWPYFCGNLFPCHSDPSDGTTFQLQLTGVPDGETAVYPETIDLETASYVLAWARGRYTYRKLGSSRDGIEIGVYWLPGGENQALQGAEYLVDQFNWYEQTLGRYLFGPRAASVSVDWGGGDYGGMEHHPYWHISSGSMYDVETHAHEAAHGWYGDGVRIACWEDFVLSEGTVSYLTARVFGAVQGPQAEAALWDEYHNLLLISQATEDMIAWPEGCNQIDMLEDLFGFTPYMKGAFFFKDLEGVIGRDALDSCLAGFYQERVGTAARFQELLDYIYLETGYDPTPLAEAWLRSSTIP